MKPADPHINLLQRSGPARTVSWSLAALLAVTTIAMVYYGSRLQEEARQATRRRDEVAQQLKLVQASLAVATGEQDKNASTLALRKEIDALQPQAQAAQALIDATRGARAGEADEFGRALAAITGIAEPGLWLTALTVSEAGKRLELNGEARNGALVLRFARRANEALQPLALRMGSLEMKPGAGGTAPAAPAATAGTVSFHLF